MNNLILPSSSGATMTSRQIAELVGSRHDKVKQTIERLSKDNQNRLAVIQLPPMGDVKNHLGQTVEEYVFSGSQGERDSYIVVAQLSPEFTATLVDEWQRLKKGHHASLPDFNDPAAMAIAWAEQYKSAQLAIATKAEIGNRREATAMNTASQAVKRANKLEIELDQSQEWSTIKRMEIITGLSFNWRLLKSAGADLGIDSKDVFDPNFGTVKAYHADVWREAYALDIKQ